MKRPPILVLLSAILCSNVVMSFAAEDNYRLLPFMPSEPLCSSSVAAVIQDSQGFIWFGTPDGVDRYDGYETLHIPFPDDCSGYGNIRTMCEDNDGNIWMGSFKGICVWDRTAQKIRKYSQGAVARIVKTRDGTLWVAANYAGFLKIEPSSGQCDTLSFAYHNASAHYGEDVCYDGTETVYFLNGVGAVYSCGLADNKLQVLVPYTKTLFRTPSHSISHIDYLDGYLCGGRRNHDTYFYEIASGSFYSRPWGGVSACGKTLGGGSYLSCSDGMRYFPAGLKMENGGNENEKLLYADPIQAVLLDLDGAFWLGTVENGVQRLIPNRTDFRSIELQDESFEVNKLLPYADGTLWIATSSSGLLHYYPEEDRLMKVPLPYSINQVSGLGAVGENVVVTTPSAKAPLIILEPTTGKTEVHPEFQTDLNVVLDDRQGGFYIGGWLFEAHPEKRWVSRIERVRTSITDMKEDALGRQWFGTSFSGIWMKDGKKWNHYTDSSGVVMRTTSLLPDSDGNIWIASQDDGLQKFNPQTGKVNTYTEFGGVTCTRISGIASDSDGTLWLTTPRGMATFDTISSQTSFYSMSDGIESSRPGSVHTVAIGDILFIGDHNGLRRFNPVRFRQTPGNSGKIVFTGFSLPGQADRQNFIPDPSRLADISSKSTIRLRSTENSFVIGVSQMDFGIPVSTRLVFRLEGLDGEWIPVVNGCISITNLQSGQYRLTVRKIGRNTPVVLDESSIKIVIARPVMASLPAIIIYLALLVGGVFFVVRQTQKRAFRKAQESARIESERKDAEREKLLYASKVEFLTTIAHEIRTPLTLVMAPVESLQQKLATLADKSVKEELDVVERNADKLSRMLDELLDFRKLESSGLEINPAEYEIDAIVRSVFNRFSFAAKRKNVELTLSLPADSITAAVDKNALDKIVTNLLSNAIKYAGSFVTLSLQRVGETFVITTENDGIPVPVTDRERIFRPFERYVGEGSVETGTGIGLFVSRNLTELHGGTLTMDSDMSINRFLLTIPIAHISELSMPASSLPEILIPQQKITVLVVEDNPDMLDFIVRQFPSEYSVLAAQNGKEALEIIGRNPLVHTNCVVSDVMMPQMDGLELCRALKDNPRTSDIPVILLTARSDGDSRMSGLEYGADAYLSKPFSVRELLSVISNVIRNRQRLREKYSLSVGSMQLTNDSPDAILLSKIDSYIKNHLMDESLGVETLSAEACMSTSGLYKKMKSLVGMGPGDYILLVRLRTSAELLQDTAIPISEVAFKTGFRSTSYFSSCFKARFGVTPKDYRAGVR